MALGLFHGASLQGGDANGGQYTFAALPPRNVKMGSVEVSKVTLVTLAGAQKDTHTSDFDGLLTMGFVKRVFVDHADNFALLDPW